MSDQRTADPVVQRLRDMDTGDDHTTQQLLVDAANAIERWERNFASERVNVDALRAEKEKLWVFVRRVAEYDDYTHDEVDEAKILHTLQHEAKKLL